MSSEKPVKLAILWHMHQPDYRDPQSGNMVMPWVRLHALKDYLDMPLLATRYENIRVTFNLVPSLIEQLDDYLNGATDPHLVLSAKDAGDLTTDEKREILDSFFAGPPNTMIRPHQRYFQLYTKAQSNLKDEVLPDIFSSEEMRDIQVWSNLSWIDPIFRKEQPIKRLFDKGSNFSENDKAELLEWQLSFLKRIIPTYKELYQNGKIDISFTPYFHPIVPLLCDSESAREAMPEADLPKNRFQQPDDANWHIKSSVDKFSELFEQPISGMWPSEGSVSEMALRLFAENNVKWIATDEDILFQSMKKENVNCEKCAKFALYEYSGVKMFFRDHALSDRVGFVYSGMETETAVEDFISHIHNIRKHCADNIDNTIIPVILDGENAWEYFRNDGYEFLDLFYRRLSEDPLIETVTMTEATEKLPATNLKQLFAGSWINHNFKIWIGHSEDNAAWDLLSSTRKALVDFVKAHPDYDREKIKKAYRQIYRAEGSDWCWWYGPEHRGPQNEQFDEIFRNHLIAVYELLDLKVPSVFYNPIYHSQIETAVVQPDAILTPTIDGRQTYYYEWATAGYLENISSGGAMHQVDQYVKRLMFAYDHDNLYIRLDFNTKKLLELFKKINLIISFSDAGIEELDLPLSTTPSAIKEDYAYALDEIFELALKRNWLLKTGFGRIGLRVILLDDQNELEAVPASDPIIIEIPEIDQELFWPT